MLRGRESARRTLRHFLNCRTVLKTLRGRWTEDRVALHKNAAVRSSDADVVDVPGQDHFTVWCRVLRAEAILPLARFADLDAALDNKMGIPTAVAMLLEIFAPINGGSVHW